MKWIKYQIVCNADKNILLNKKLEYTEANLAIAENEAYNGYTIEEDETSFKKEPLSIELGGTGATNAADALRNLGITFGTEDLVEGVSELATGAVYIVYE